MSRGNHGRRHLIMQLGRAIIGAIIGAAIGIAVLVGVYLALGIDAVWLAIPVALLTGFGVRMMVSTWGHASYLRGAMTGVLALGAYLLGWWLVAQVATQRANAAADTRIDQKATAEQPAEAGDDVDETKVAEAPEPAKAPAPSRPAAGAAMRKAIPPGQSPWDYVWLGVAALIAYELGRGTAAKAVAVGEETTTEVPANTHPDA
jgi:hypothetical protein